MQAVGLTFCLRPGFESDRRIRREVLNKYGYYTK